MDDKRQPQHTAADEGIGRKSLSGGEKIFDDGEFCERIWAELVFIEGEIAGRGLQAGVSQSRIVGQQARFHFMP